MKILEILTEYTFPNHGIKLIDDDSRTTIQIEDLKTEEKIYIPREDFWAELGAFTGFDLREDDIEHIADAMHSAKFRASIGDYCRWVDDFLKYQPNFTHTTDMEVTYTC